MYVVAVTVWVKPEFIQQFIEASLDNARNSRKEPGNIRWDFLQAEHARIKRDTCRQIGHMQSEVVETESCTRRPAVSRGCVLLFCPRAMKCDRKERQGEKDCCYFHVW